MKGQGGGGGGRWGPECMSVRKVAGQGWMSLGIINITEAGYGNV